MSQKISRSPFIAGVDEAGRGSLAGPVFAAAVILPDNFSIPDLKDSKKLSPNNRLEIAESIKYSAIVWSIGRVEVQEIDQLNVFTASLLAMKRAVLNLSVFPEEILVDGTHVFSHISKVRAIIKGDALIPQISAASIIAKVARDTEMVALDSVYPEYEFATHKGYGTDRHLKALRKYGYSDLHRKTFSPIKEMVRSESGWQKSSVKSKKPFTVEVI